MKITNITVRAGRTVGHPLEQYGNLRADIEYVATLADGDDADACRQQLQQQAETEIEQHVADLKLSIEDFAEHASRQRQIKRLEQQLAETEAQLQESKAAAERDADRPLLKFS